MKYADVEAIRREAAPGLSGKCPHCESKVVAKCGEVKAWHWAHAGCRTCDPWWENETDWHRDWKNTFPTEWQEVQHRAENGERHIADVKTSAGVVVEFQHSYLNPDERRSREAFYGRMVWVLDGMRRKSNLPQVLQALPRKMDRHNEVDICRVWIDDCRILREWSDCRAPVYLDFGDELGDGRLCCVNPTKDGPMAVLHLIDRSDFVQHLRKGQDLKTYRVASKADAGPVTTPPRRPRPPTPKHRKTLTFRQYLARKDRARRRIRL